MASNREALSAQQRYASCRCLKAQAHMDQGPDTATDTDSQEKKEIAIQLLRGWSQQQDQMDQQLP